MADQLKPSVEQLGIDPGTLVWRRSGAAGGTQIEIAFTCGDPGPAGSRGALGGRGPTGDPGVPGDCGATGDLGAMDDRAASGDGAEAGDWVLMRTTSPAGPVLVFTRFEWECFLDGAKSGEFDDAKP